MSNNKRLNFKSLAHVSLIRLKDEEVTIILGWYEQLTQIKGTLDMKDVDVKDKLYNYALELDRVRGG